MKTPEISGIKFHLVGLSGDYEGTSHNLEVGIIWLGRGSDPAQSQPGHLVFVDQSVSREHAVLVWAEDYDSFVLHHRSQTNPTFLNQVPIAEPKLLRPGDIIAIGRQILRFDPLVKEAPKKASIALSPVPETPAETSEPVAEQGSGGIPLPEQEPTPPKRTIPIGLDLGSESEAKVEESNPFSISSDKDEPEVSPSIESDSGAESNPFGISAAEPEPPRTEPEPEPAPPALEEVFPEPTPVAPPPQEVADLPEEPDNPFFSSSSAVDVPAEPESIPESPPSLEIHPFGAPQESSEPEPFSSQPAETTDPTPDTSEELSPFGVQEPEPALAETNPFGSPEPEPVEPEANPFGTQEPEPVEPEVNPFGTQEPEPVEPEVNPFGSQEREPAEPEVNPFGSPEPEPIAAEPNPFGSPEPEPAPAEANPFGSPEPEPVAAEPNPFGSPEPEPVAAEPNPFGSLESKPGVAEEPSPFGTQESEPVEPELIPFGSPESEPSPEEPTSFEESAPAEEPFGSTSRSEGWEAQFPSSPAESVIERASETQDLAENHTSEPEPLGERVGMLELEPENVEPAAEAENPLPPVASDEPSFSGLSLGEDSPDSGTASPWERPFSSEPSPEPPEEIPESEPALALQLDLAENSEPPSPEEAEAPSESEAFGFRSMNLSTSAQPEPEEASSPEPDFDSFAPPPQTEDESSLSLSSFPSEEAMAPIELSSAPFGASLDVGESSQREDSSSFKPTPAPLTELEPEPQPHSEAQTSGLDDFDIPDEVASVELVSSQEEEPPNGSLDFLNPSIDTGTDPFASSAPFEPSPPPATEDESSLLSLAEPPEESIEAESEAQLPPQDSGAEAGGEEQEYLPPPSTESEDFPSKETPSENEAPSAPLGLGEITEPAPDAPAHGLSMAFKFSGQVVTQSASENVILRFLPECLNPRELSSPDPETALYEIPSILRAELTFTLDRQTDTVFVKSDSGSHSSTKRITTVDGVQLELPIKANERLKIGPHDMISHQNCECLVYSGQEEDLDSFAQSESPERFGVLRFQSGPWTGATVSFLSNSGTTISLGAESQVGGHKLPVENSPDCRISFQNEKASIAVTEGQDGQYISLNGELLFAGQESALLSGSGLFLGSLILHWTQPKLHTELTRYQLLFGESVFPISKSLVRIGTAAHCEILISGTGLAGVTGNLEYTTSGFVYHHLEPSYPALIDGEHITEGQSKSVQDGSQFQLGMGSILQLQLRG